MQRGTPLCTHVCRSVRWLRNKPSRMIKNFLEGKSGKEHYGTCRRCCCCLFHSQFPSPLVLKKTENTRNLLSHISLHLRVAIQCSSGQICGAEVRGVSWKGRAMPKGKLLLSLFLEYATLWASQGASGKEPACQCRRLRDASLIPGPGRSPGGGNGSPIQYSCLEDPMDGGAWQATVHGVIENWTRRKWLSIRVSTWLGVEAVALWQWGSKPEDGCACWGWQKERKG